MIVFDLLGDAQCANFDKKKRKGGDRVAVAIIFHPDLQGLSDF